MTGRCKKSSWRGKGHEPYGPGEFNRCVKERGHVKAGDERHQDEWGNVFVLKPSFRVVRVVTR